MPKTDWKGMSLSSDARRRKAGIKSVFTPTHTVASLMKLNRDKLNAQAAVLGIANPDAMANKREVAEAILNA